MFKRKQANEAIAALRQQPDYVFTWTTPSGKTRSVQADRVTFEHGHVAFWELKWQYDTYVRTLLCAENNNSVYDLQVSRNPRTQ